MSLCRYVMWRMREPTTNNASHTLENENAVYQSFLPTASVTVINATVNDRIFKDVGNEFQYRILSEVKISI